MNAGTSVSEGPHNWTLRVAKFVVEGGSPKERADALAQMDHEFALFLEWVKTQQPHIRVGLEVETVTPEQVLARVHRAAGHVPAVSG